MYSIIKTNTVNTQVISIHHCCYGDECTCSAEHSPQVLIKKQGQISVSLLHKTQYKSTNGTEVQGSICPPSLQVKFEDPTCRAVFSISLYGAPKSILFGTGLFVPLVQLFMIIVSLIALTLS